MSNFHGQDLASPTSLWIPLGFSFIYKVGPCTQAIVIEVWLVTGPRAVSGCFSALSRDLNLFQWTQGKGLPTASLALGLPKASPGGLSELQSQTSTMGLQQPNVNANAGVGKGPTSLYITFSPEPHYSLQGNLG